MRSIESDIIITGIRAKVDGSLGFNATTPELSPEEKVAFMELQGINLKMLVVPLDEKNAPQIRVDKEIDSKTPGQRLRAVLYVLWEQGKKDKDYESFYKDRMEKFIEAVKDKLL